MSTPELPKQFVPLFEGSTLFEMALLRVGSLSALTPWVVTAQRHKSIVERTAAEAGVSTRLILEPEGRNTAPAVAAAALLSDQDEVLFIVPADSFMTDLDSFRTNVEDAVSLAETGRIVALGVVPTRPETGYGYIESGEPLAHGSEIASFVEKPEPSDADRLVAAGSLWNAGMFIAKAGVLIEQFEMHSPQVLDDVAQAVPDRSESRDLVLSASFADVESISVDHAIMEKTDVGAVVPLDAGWSDVGSFKALLEVLPRDDAGNHILGAVDALDVTNSLLVATGRRLAIAGVNGQAVVETEDAVLVIDLDQSQSVKKLADSN